MPKADWDETADGEQLYYEHGDASDPCIALFEEYDGLVHAIDGAYKNSDEETYTMVCEKVFNHETVKLFLGQKVTCLVCLADE